ncbi:MAG: hypothetical protein LBF41_10510 [Deltaproteobacteria bacterium]|jgi:DNA-binding CsgD family transcriptional regulator|nr:hypothetical protein [Deltaproteobacteria bacterium]
MKEDKMDIIGTQGGNDESSLPRSHDSLLVTIVLSTIGLFCSKLGEILGISVVGKNVLEALRSVSGVWREFDDPRRNELIRVALEECAFEKSQNNLVHRFMEVSLCLLNKLSDPCLFDYLYANLRVLFCIVGHPEMTRKERADLLGIGEKAFSSCVSRLNKFMSTNNELSLFFRAICENFGMFPVAAMSPLENFIFIATCDGYTEKEITDYLYPDHKINCRVERRKILAKFNAKSFEELLSFFVCGNGPKDDWKIFMGIVFRFSPLLVGEVESGKLEKIALELEKRAKEPSGGEGKE